jgi:hypothetical protein
MTEQQRKQAVSAMSALILTWLQRRRLEQARHRTTTSAGPASTSPARHTDDGENERPADGIDAGVRTL